MQHFLYPWSEVNTHSPEDVLWRLRNLCLLACQVRVSLGNSGLSVKLWLSPFVDSSAFRSLWSWCLIMNPAWLEKGHCLVGVFAAAPQLLPQPHPLHPCLALDSINTHADLQRPLGKAHLHKGCMCIFRIICSCAWEIGRASWSFMFVKSACPQEFY